MRDVRPPPFQNTPTPEPRREPLRMGFDWVAFWRGAALLIGLGVLVYSCTPSVAQTKNPADLLYDFLYPPRAPVVVPTPKPQAEPEPTTTTTPPVVVVVPTPTPTVVEPEPPQPKRKRIAVTKTKPETFTRKPKAVGCASASGDGLPMLATCAAVCIYIRKSTRDALQAEGKSRKASERQACETRACVRSNCPDQYSKVR